MNASILFQYIQYLMLSLLLAMGSSCGSKSDFQGSQSVKPKSPSKKKQISSDEVDEEPSAPVEQELPTDVTEQNNADVTPLFESKLVALQLVNSREVQVPIDMFWVVDNSGSMEGEVAQVRANFDRFVTTVSARSDVRVTLVNNPTPTANTGITLSPNIVAAGAVQLPYPIGDRSHFAGIAAGFCPAETSDIVANPTGNKPLPYIGTNVAGVNVKICNQDVFVPEEDGNFATLNTQSHARCPAAATAGEPADCSFRRGDAIPHFLQTGPVQNLKGKLLNRLRPNSKIVIVVVTDDESTIVNETNFINLVRPYIGDRKVEVYAFTGVPNVTQDGVGTCSIATNGLSYGRSFARLAAQTGGKIYDICASNWAGNFDQMASSLKTTLDAVTIYELGQANVEAIENVKIDGVLIPSDKYSLRDGKQIVLERSVILSTSQNIEIVLKIKR